MKTLRGYHLVFGLTLLALAALGTWWLIFFARAVEFERDARMSQLRHAAVVAALTLGHRSQPPAPGRIEGPVTLEIVPRELAGGDRPGVPIGPLHPQFVVRPAAAPVDAVEQALWRRKIMVFGEGLLMLVLLAVCTFMLYRLVRQERRHMRRMETFVAAVTHEMKTPLTGLKSLLQTFSDGRVPQSEQAKLYAMGLKEAERLEHMVENILIAGRLRGGAYRVHNEPVALRPFLEGFVEHRRRYLVDRPDAVGLVWEPRAEDVAVHCDPQALRIVLENLTDNAFKYGGSQTGPPQVTLRVRHEPGRVRLSVEDAGMGFDPDRAEDLFVPFTRVITGPAASQHGTGLGLPISRELARRMGGEIQARSPGPGKGSRFTVSLREVEA